MPRSVLLILSPFFFPGWDKVRLSVRVGAHLLRVNAAVLWDVTSQGWRPAPSLLIAGISPVAPICSLWCLRAASDDLLVQCL